MAEETQDVNTEDSSTTEDVNTEDSSTSEDVNDTEDSSTTEEQTHEETVPYDRFQSANERAGKAEQETAYYKGLAERPEVVQPTTDPDANLDPQTRDFYHNMDKRTQGLIDKAVDAERKVYQANYTALASQNAKMQEKFFRQEVTDVVPDSPEDIKIANKIAAGYTPEDAAWAVMGAKRVESAKVTGKTKQQNKTQMKADANLEVSGVPPNSGVPTGEKLSFRETLDKKMRDAGQ